MRRPARGTIDRWGELATTVCGQ